MPIFRKLPKSRQQFFREGICRLNGFETVRVDLKRPDLRIQSRSWHAELGRYTRSCGHASAAAIVSFRSFSDQTRTKSMSTERAWTR
jgi:diaminopimelate epimerase